MTNSGKKIANEGAAAQPASESVPPPTMPEINPIAAVNEREGTTLAPGQMFWPGMN
jgi:hypothetical protein